LGEDAGKVQVNRLLITCAELNQPRLKSYLPRVLAKPKSRHEYRRAFELSRTLAERPIPKDLLEAEENIKTYGYKSGGHFSQDKVNAAAALLAQAEDVDAAAHIALSLACAVTKGDWGPANQAGLTILKQLADNRGVQTARNLYENCDDRWVRDRLKPMFRSDE
jgi:hypothetical protein